MTFSRTAGPRIAEMIELFSGISLDHVSACGQAEMSIPELPTKFEQWKHYGWVLFPPREGVLIDAPEKCNLPWVRTFAFSGNRNEVYHLPQKSSEHIGWAVVEGASFKETEERLAILLAWFEQNTNWKPR